MSDQTSALQRFWEDLKRRHVVRVAIGYAIAAWALVEVAEVLLPTVDAPGWVFRAIIAGAFLGFPVTIILTWLLDISGRGVVVTESRGIVIPKWVKAVVAVPLLGLVGVTGWWVWSGYVEEQESSVRPTDLEGRVPIVAVMPIRNHTGDTGLDWYSEGLANLVRDNLTRSRFLRVVSPVKWQSIVAGATTEADIAARAAEEGIGYILSGDMINTPGGITVSSRLTDTQGGVALSSRQVDGLTAESLLTAAGPIATQVKQGLNVPREEQVDVFAADFATSNLSAYESYIAGLGFFVEYQYRKAEQSFTAALQLAPDFAVARYRLAYIQAVTSRTEEALTNIGKALQSEYLADRERQYIEAAQALFSRDYADADARYQALLERYPFEIEARELLAKTYWGQYRQREAVELLRELANEEPQNQVIWSTLGSHLVSMGEFEQAEPALQRLAQLAPDNPNSYALLGDSLRYQGNFVDAAEQYRKALEIDPKMREVAASLAAIDYMQGEVGQAMAAFQNIVESEELIVRERLDALFPLVSLLAARGDFPAAIAQLDRFADQLKEERIRQAMAISMKALFQLELGREAPARELAEAAISLSPGVPTRYLFARGLIELDTGQYQQAQATAQQIAGHALPPDDPDRTEDRAAAYLTGMALLAQGQPQAARASLQQATALDGYPYRLYELGLARALLQAGDPGAALQTVTGATEPDPSDPRIDLEPDRVRAVLLAAEIHQAAGDATAARAAAHRFLERFDRAEPTHPLAMRAAQIADAAESAGLQKRKGDPLAAFSVVQK
jgi:tetratricopeptide (TPR) repeat protein